MARVSVARILVLDDDEALCRRLGSWLAAARYDVVTFSQIAGALEHLQRAPAHVALIDLQMPDVVPRDALTAVGRAAPRARLLAMAAFPTLELALDAMRSGAHDLLEKPLQTATLLAAVERQAHQVGLIARTETELAALIGQRLRGLRAALSKTQAEVAAEAGISPAQLSQIESGKSATSLWTLSRLCAALDQPLRALFDEPLG